MGAGSNKYSKTYTPDQNCKDRIVDWRFVVLKNPPPGQWAVRLIYDGGRRLFRLKDRAGNNIVPTPGISSIDDEAPDIQIAVRGAVIDLVQDHHLIESFVPVNRHYKTCAQAMIAYLKWRGDNLAQNPRHHESEFVKYFGPKPLSEISRKSVAAFAEYLKSWWYKSGTKSRF